MFIKWAFCNPLQKRTRGLMAPDGTEGVFLCSRATWLMPLVCLCSHWGFTLTNCYLWTQKKHGEVRQKWNSGADINGLTWAVDDGAKRAPGRYWFRIRVDGVSRVLLGLAWVLKPCFTTLSQWSLRFTDISSQVANCANFQACSESPCVFACLVP